MLVSLLLFPLLLLLVKVAFLINIGIQVSTVDMSTELIVLNLSLTLQFPHLVSCFLVKIVIFVARVFVVKVFVVKVFVVKVFVVRVDSMTAGVLNRLMFTNLGESFAHDG